MPGVATTLSTAVIAPILFTRERHIEVRMIGSVSQRQLRTFTTSKFMFAYYGDYEQQGNNHVFQLYLDLTIDEPVRI